MRVMLLELGGGLFASFGVFFFLLAMMHKASSTTIIWYEITLSAMAYMPVLPTLVTLDTKSKTTNWIA